MNAFILSDCKRNILNIKALLYASKYFNNKHAHPIVLVAIELALALLKTFGVAYRPVQRLCNLLSCCQFHTKVKFSFKTLRKLLNLKYTAQTFGQTGIGAYFFWLLSWLNFLVVCLLQCVK